MRPQPSRPRLRFRHAATTEPARRARRREPAGTRGRAFASCPRPSFAFFFFSPRSNIMATGAEWRRRFGRPGCVTLIGDPLCPPALLHAREHWPSPREGARSFYLPLRAARTPRRAGRWRRRTVPRFTCCAERRPRGDAGRTSLRGCRRAKSRHGGECGGVACVAV